MTEDIIRKKVEEIIEGIPVTEKSVVFEKVSERVERFTVEQIDAEIANLQTRIDLLNDKKTKALALGEE